LASRINAQPPFRRDRAAPGNAHRTGTWHTFDCLADALNGLTGRRAAGFKMSRSDVDARVPVHVTMIMQPQARVQAFPSCSHSLAGYARQMSHIVSARRRTSRTMASPLSNFVGWRLVIDCAGSRCPWGWAYDVSQLAELYRGVTVSAALRRMRCSQCGCSPATAALKSPDGDTRSQEIALVGPGSYYRRERPRHHRWGASVGIGSIPNSCRT
jgi:hypothetical protein